MFTYTHNPKENEIDYIRFKLGDTQSNNYVLHDAEIKSVIDSHSNINKALIECCEAIIAYYAPKVSHSLGPQSVSMKEAFDNYSNLLTKLKARYGTSAPCFTGNPVPEFNIGMHDNV